MNTNTRTCDHDEPRRSTGKRRGVATVEGAIVLSLLLMILFVILDLGLAVFRYNTLAEDCRNLARSVILHGADAPASAGTWGPADFVGTAADVSPIAQGADLTLATMPAADVNIRVVWLDGDNQPGDRVRVEVAYQHQSVGASLVGYGTIDLAGVSIMRIVQ